MLRVRNQDLRRLYLFLCLNNVFEDFFLPSIVLGAGRRKEEELVVMMLQACKSCSQGFGVIAEEMILKIGILELHQTNYFETCSTVRKQQSGTTI